MRVIADAGRLQAEIGGRRLAADREQQVRAFDDVLLIARRRRARARARDRPRRAPPWCSRGCVTPSWRELLEHDLGQLGVVLAERLRRLDHRDARAEPAVRLRQLQADGAAADDDQIVAGAPDCRRSSRW